MHTGKMIFSQLMDFVSMQDFHTCVDRYQGHFKVKSFSCWDQFLCMAFAQLTGRESLRDIETCLRAVSNKLYHAGFRGKVSRNTLANANRKRDWRIFHDFASGIIAEARSLYRNDAFQVDLANTVYALDSTTIDLCLSLFPWAPFERSRAAVKLHTMIDLRGNIPTFCVITGGRVHDVKILDQILFETGAYYILDRGYLDYARLNRIHQENAWFVTRSNANTALQRVYSQPVNKENGILVDQIVVFAVERSRHRYPEQLRRIRYYDSTKDLHLELLTNQKILPAKTIADLYRARWQIELFFRWIKQHLHIKAFYGNSKNAVKTQIWIAITVYVLVAIVKKRLGIEASLYSLLQILSVTLFEKKQLKQLLTVSDYRNQTGHDFNQLFLFE